MRKYQGLDSSNDQIVGGGAYVQEHGFGHEIFNFKPHEGYMYGFVQAKSIINIKRLGGLESDSSINDILVVWVARDPKGGTYIVGWYDQATVYRDYQTSPQNSKRVYKNEQIGYRVKAKQENCQLLTIDKRTFLIPRQQEGGMGQSNVWYADKPNHVKFKDKVLDFIANGGLPISLNQKTTLGESGWQPDPYKRKMIEQKAIETTVAHYKILGYTVDSVEKDNMGWDLQATYESKSLKLEVKGLSGNAIAIELTPNEYAKMKEHKDDYRICVVANALTPQPLLNIFAFSYETNHWEDDDGNKLEINETISAKMCLV